MADKENKLVYLPLEEIKPYPNNPRINDNAIDAVAASIREFKAQNPIILDKNKVIICGHTRLLAAKKLGLKTFPCIITDMSERKAKAYRLADNKTAEKATWDIEALNIELDDLSSDFDMQDFGFDYALDGFNSYQEAQEIKHEIEQASTQNRVEGILNLDKANFEGVGQYDIPQIQPVYELPEIKEWIGFNYVLSDKNPEGKAVHFFVDDYQFMRIWNNPDAYIDKLSQYVCVASPDFSPYGDMPIICQMFNHYRKHWLAAYWQMHGITVIPTIRSSIDERSLGWYLDGEPHNGIVLTSSMWANMNDKILEYSKKEYDLMYKTLTPKKVLVYGKTYDWMYGNISQIPTFTDKAWGR